MTSHCQISPELDIENWQPLLGEHRLGNLDFLKLFNHQVWAPLYFSFS